MTVLTLALLAGSQPAAPRLAPVHQIGPQSRRQSPHTPCAPLVRTDALTLTWQKADRYKRSAPTSSSHTPWPNPHSACGTAAAPLPAISCLGAFRPPAARARGEVRHCRQPKTCTHEFIRRFLIHVLPHGFHRIRHYGLFANSNRAANIARARELLAVPSRLKEPETSEAAIDEPRVLLRPCPCCGGRMIIIETFARGCEPKHQPETTAPVIRIDTS